jgi:WD40 repeat protein
MLASGSEGATAKLWDVETGRELTTLVGHTGEVSSVAFSPDGRTLASGSWDKTAKLWDVASGRELRTLAGHIFDVGSVAFSRDGRTLASGSFDNTVKLWDVATGREIRILDGRTDGVISLAFSANGRTLASGNRNGTAKLWDVATGQELRTLAGDTRLAFSSVAFSPDGRTLASGSDDGSAKLWDVASGRQLRTLTGHDSGIACIAFSPDGSTVASGRGDVDGTIKLWDAASGEELRSLTGHTDGIVSLAFNPDGRMLASGSWDGFIKLWEVATGRELRTLEGHSYEVVTVAFSPDRSTLASGSRDRTVKLWDVETGRELHTLVGYTSIVDAVAFSPDGRTLASGESDDSGVRLWDVASGRALRALTGHANGVDAVAFSPDGRTLASGSLDGSARLWNAKTGESLAELISIGRGDDWLVVAPDGLFDGSPAAWQQVLWRFNNNTFDVVPAEVFFRDFYHPGLMGEILEGKHPSATANIEDIDRRQPQVAISLTQPQITEPVSDRRISLTVNLNEAPADKKHPSAGSGVRDVRLFRNGSLVKIWRGDVDLDKNGKAPLVAEDVAVVAGENRFTAYAFSKSNIKSTDVNLTVTGANAPSRKSVAYILAIGINEYANARPKLKFAVNDADDFADTLRDDQAKLAQFDQSRIVRLTDANATKQNILSALKRLAGTEIGSLQPGEPKDLAKIEPAQPEDAVFIYFAGHGSAPGKESKRFYLIAQDFEPESVGPAAPGADNDTIPGAINDIEFGAIAEKIDAKYIVLVIDACQSGKTLESDDPRQGPMNSQGLAQLAYEKGMYILAAAQGDEAALELSRYKHGLLTYALVEEGLKQGKADDAPKDGQILLREWLDYTTVRLPELQMDGMKRMAALGREISIVRRAQARGVSPDDRETQRPRVFYRRESDPQPIVIAKP